MIHNTKYFKIIYYLIGFTLIAPTITCQQNDTIQKYGYHFQQTLVGQIASTQNLTTENTGRNSFSDQNLKISLSSTFYFGFKLWKNGSFYINPDIAGGAGLGGTVGLAGYVNGEIFRVGNPAPTFYISRAFFRQYIKLNSEYKYVQPNANQLGEYVPTKRIQITLGKFTLSDMFDNNYYSHDPRTRFLNWSLMNSGSYDFASNTKGYTYGCVLEYITPKFSTRAGLGEMPQYSNGPLNINRTPGMVDMETSLFRHGYGLNFEIEKPIHLKNGKSTIIRFLFYSNTANAGKYTDALSKIDSYRYANIDTFYNNASNSLASSRTNKTIKYGFSLNIEQPIGKHIGLFSRLSWNNGKTESFAFAEIDRSASIGLVLHGAAYKRDKDRILIASVINGISKEHQAYLQAGEYGFMLGEPNLIYKPEIVIEFQYVYHLGKSFFISPDYQLIINPGYDSNRGNVNVFGIRSHIEF